MKKLCGIATFALSAKKTYGHDDRISTNILWNIQHYPLIKDNCGTASKVQKIVSYKSRLTLYLAVSQLIMIGERRK